MTDQEAEATAVAVVIAGVAATAYLREGIHVALIQDLPQGPARDPFLALSLDLYQGPGLRFVAVLAGVPVDRIRLLQDLKRATLSSLRSVAEKGYHYQFTVQTGGRVLH